MSEPKAKITWRSFVIPTGFTALHIGAALVFFVDISWVAIGLFLAFYWLRLFGITAGLHRLFAHRSYKAARWFQFLVGFLGAAACQGGPLWWAAHHRRHHKYSDMDEDPHSPIAKSVFYAHVGWVLTPGIRTANVETMKDWFKYPEIKLLDRFELVPALIQAGLCYLIGYLTGAGGWSCVVWGFLASTVVLYHCTFIVNSLPPVRQPAIRDHRRQPEQLVAGHADVRRRLAQQPPPLPDAARQGFKWYEFDLSYYILKALNWVGLVWDLRQPTERAMAKNLVAAK